MAARAAFMGTSRLPSPRAVTAMSDNAVSTAGWSRAARTDFVRSIWVCCNVMSIGKTSAGSLSASVNRFTPTTIFSPLSTALAKL